MRSHTSAGVVGGRVTTLRALLPLALALALSALPLRPAAAESVVFSDDFTDFDLSVWEHELTAGGGGNWEFQYYTNNRTNSYVRDGILFLRPTLTADAIGERAVKTDGKLSLWGSSPANLCTGNDWWGCERTAGAGGNYLNPIQSARIRTAQSMNIRFGRVEVRAKMPKGDWIWPAIWMLPRWNSYGGWPASGEIDIAESRGNANGYPGGVDTVGCTLHWGPDWAHNAYALTHSTKKLQSGTFNDNFHVFGMKWTETGLYTYVDDDANRVLQVSFDRPFWQRGGWANTTFTNPWAGRSNTAPFDRKFFLVMNVAVGGINYFTDGVGGKPWANAEQHAVNSFYDRKDQWYPTWQGESAALQIDWVKVYQ